MRELNQISGAIIEAAIEVHREVGPGLMESPYTACLAYELGQRAMAIETQVALPVIYKGARLGILYRIDLLVENVVVVEIKAVANVLPVHEAQLLSYLRLSNRRLALMLNFHEARLVDGLKRVVNGY